MKEKEISVSEVARNFADYVNRAHYQGAEFVLVRDGVKVARLVPAQKATGSGKDLAEAVEKAKLSLEERRVWAEELKKGHKVLKAPEDRWA